MNTHPEKRALPSVSKTHNLQRSAASQTCVARDIPEQSTSDHLIALGQATFGTPMAWISVLEEHRQLLAPATVLGTIESMCDLSFGTHTVLRDDPLVVLNTLEDARFRDSPLVTGASQVRFYAGVPLITANGTRFGTYCVLDTEPRAEFSFINRELLLRFGALAAAVLEQHTSPARVAEAKQAVADADERYRLVTRATSDGIWDWDRSSGSIFYSARLRSMLGLPEEDVHGAPEDLLSRLHPGDPDRVRSELQAVFDEGKPDFECEFRIRHEDGTWRWFHSRGIATRYPAGEVCRLTGACSDVTARRVRDELTGLHSRISLLNTLDLRIRELRNSSENFAIILVDLNQFKKINDSFGHSYGDLLLVEVANRIQLTLGAQSENIVARIVGDKFAILLHRVRRESDAVRHAAKLHAVIQMPSLCGDQEIKLSASIGIAFGSPDVTCPEQMLHDAETAMHQARTEGGRQTAVFCPTIRQRALEKISLVVDLRNALASSGVVLHYQPKVLLSTGELVGFEALMRWPHPRRGFVPPSEFIPLAEESDLILEIGRWTLREAIRQLAEWRREGLVAPTTTVAVNLSAKQFCDEHLVENLLRKLRMHNLPAACLKLEVTEGILISDASHALRVLRGVRAIGVGVDLDDFGTGYSSLQYLQRFPFDALKVDRSFVNSLGEGAGATIASSIIALGRALKLQVIAEGIETPEQEQSLRAMGCEYGQGYLYSKPLPPAQMKQLLRGRFAWKPTASEWAAEDPAPLSVA